MPSISTEYKVNQQSLTQSYIEGLVSVLVPLYNEEEFVGALIERVLAARSSLFEVYAVYGRSLAQLFSQLGQGSAQFG